MATQLLETPDAEEVEFLTEELIKLAERMNRLCIGLMKAKSDRNHPLHILASYMQLNAVELRAYLNGTRGS